MMSAATRHHLARCSWALLVTALLLAGATWVYQAFQAGALVERLRAAEIAHVPAIIRELGPFRRRAASLLDAIASDAARPRPERLHAALALVHWDRADARSLIGPLLEGGPEEIRVIAEELSSHRPGVLDPLWRAARDPVSGPGRRLRAACALAGLDPTAPQWPDIAPQVIDALLAEDWFLGPRWVDLLRPAGRALIPSLSALAHSADDRGDRRARAMRIFLEYAAAEPEWLADLVADADARQFAELLPRLALASNRDRAIIRLRTAAASAQDDATTDDSKPGPRDMAARRRARSAAALLRLGAPETVWGLLGSASDSRAQAETIHALAEYNAEPGPLVARLGDETDPAARRGLLLAIGDLAPRLPKAVRQGGSSRAWSTCTATSLIRASTARRGDSSSPSARPDPSTSSTVPWPARRCWPGDDGSSTRGTPWSSSTRGTPIPADRSTGPSIACSPSPIAKSRWSNTSSSARTTPSSRT